MRKSFLIATIYCALAHAANAQYSYFDSIYYNQPNLVYVCKNLLYETDDGYVLGGNGVEDGAQQPHFYKLHFDGSIDEIISPNTFDMTISGWFGKEFIPTTDGGSLWSGISHYEETLQTGLVIKYNENLDTVWTLKLTIPDTTVWLYHPVEISDGYFVCGLKSFASGQPPEYEPADLLVYKVNTDGEVIWRKTHTVYDPDVDGEIVINGDTIGSLTFLRYSGIFVMDNGEIILSGSRYPHLQPFIAKLDSNGDNLQMYQFGNLEYPDWMPWLVPLDNHQFMVGYAYCFELGFDNFDYPMRYPHLMLFDADGMQALWDMEVNTTWYHRDYPMGMVRTPDGNFAKAGHYENLNVATAYIELWTPNGEMLWRKHYIHETPNPGQFDRTECYEINVTQDGGFLLCGSFYDGIQRGWVLKLDACGDVEDLGCPVGVSEWVQVNNGVHVFPNPFSDAVTIDLPAHSKTLIITDATGRQVFSQHINSGLQELNLAALASGIYVLQVQLENGSFISQRMEKF